MMFSVLNAKIFINQLKCNGFTFTVLIFFFTGFD